MRTRARCRSGSGASSQARCSDPASPSAFYEVANGQWVVAGMFTKTYTRLATMEMSVEVEDHEVEDLAFLKRIDEQLLAEGLPQQLPDLGRGGR